MYVCMYVCISFNTLIKNFRALISVRILLDTIPINGKFKFDSKNNDSKSNYSNISGNSNDKNNEWKYNDNNDSNNDDEKNDSNSSNKKFFDNNNND